MLKTINKFNAKLHPFKLVQAQKKIFDILRKMDL